MTKKDYELIASTFRAELFGVANETKIDAIKILAVNLSHVLEDENPRFDRSKFLKACGVTA